MERKKPFSHNPKYVEELDQTYYNLFNAKIEICQHLCLRILGYATVVKRVLSLQETTIAIMASLN